MGPLAFAHPAFLWFCLLGILPPLIHLLGLRKPRKLRFPPFDFVVKSERQLRSKRRIRSIILLLLRTMLLMLIPLALAGPHRAPPASQGGFALDLVIVDNSMSSMQSAGGGTAFEQIKRKALSIAAGASSANRFMLVTASEPPRLAMPFPASSASLAEAAVKNIEPTYAATSIGGAISVARAAIENAAPVSVKAHLLSDLARHGWREGEDLSLNYGGGKVPFEIFDPVPEPGSNLNPTAVNVRGTRSGISVAATVANHGGSRWKTPVRLAISGAAAVEREIDVPGRGESDATFEVEIPTRGVAAGTVSTGPDALSQDNTLAFAKRIGGAVSVLVLSGDPRPVKLADESFYFEQALKAGDPDSFHTWVAYPDSPPDDLSGFDVIAMLNCGTIPAAFASALDAFVGSGGGLLISAGDRTSPAALNALPWLPASFQAAAVQVPETGLSVKAPGDPAMEPFASEDGFLQAVKVSRRFELQPAPGATVLISTASGRPLLVKGVHGKGRVAIFGSTLDRDWNDWPIRSSYLPAVRALTASLGGSSQGLKVVDISLGEKRTVPVSYCPVWIQTGAYIAQGSVSPGRKAVDSCSQGKNGFEATFASPEVPGLYELRTDSGKVADVVVRTPPLESDLSKIPRVDIETALGISKKSAIGSMMGLPGEGQEGASPTAWLLLLAVLILGMEQWLTRRG